MLNFFIFRHGETDWNKQKRLQGMSDIPLNETGKDQAKNLKQKFKNIKVDVVLSSDLCRAKETAEIVFSDTQVEINCFSELRECDLGDAEGIFRHEFMDKYGSTFWDLWKNLEVPGTKFPVKNAETPRQHLFRILFCLESYLDMKQIINIGVSTHGGVLWRLVNNCQPCPDIPGIKNCGLHQLQFNNNLWTYIQEL